MSMGNSAESRSADGTAAAVDSPTAPADTAPRAAGLRGEQVMTDRQPSAQLAGESASVRSCWMCGIRLPARQMVADGGAACLDLRWYCRDIWGCTRRWTAHSARLAAIRPGIAETPERPAEQIAGRAATRPVAV